MTTLGDENIARVLAYPPLVWRVLSPDDPEPYEDAVANAPPPTLWARLTGNATSSAEAARNAATFSLSAGEGVTADLDKAWHGLHYLFTGTADGGGPPLDFLLAGGRPVGNLDVGYGPARVLPSAAIKEVHEALSKPDEAALRARFDPVAMTKLEIYPEIWTPSADEDDALGYLLEYAVILKDFVAQARNRGLGLLLHLN